MPRPVNELVITIAGLHGSGRSTHAKKLAETYGLRYISTGVLFRERAKELGVSIEEMSHIASRDPEFDNWLDAKTQEESRKRGVVIDANLSAWMAENPDLKIYVICPVEVRVRRIAEREKRPISEAEHETRVREESEEKRYREYYGIDIKDLSIYDVVLNTGLFSIEASADILKCVVEKYISGE